MKQKSGPGKAPADQVLKDIRRQTRRQYSAEEKIRIVLEGLRGEENISELCRRGEGPRRRAQHRRRRRTLPPASEPIVANRRALMQRSSRGVRAGNSGRLACV